MGENREIIYKECCVIGAGISGIAVARWLKYYKIDFTVIEKSDDIGGLWRYREDDYGVMDFTHINVSKYNYCYSDHPFPVDNTDYPHHSEMYNYVKSYTEKNNLYESIQFNTQVIQLEEIKPDDPVLKQEGSFNPKEKAWKILIKDTKSNEEKIIIANYVSISSGHHGTPQYAKFPGQENFKGEIIHSVKFKSAKINKMTGKKVLLVGIGNSAVDIAVNLVNEGSCPKVTVSTRSGAWIIPNYISGFATDLYACRSFFLLPWQLSTNILELVIKFIYGNPKKYNLNPKMRALQTQPTVSPTLIHHIQRRHIEIKPNIRSMNENEVVFENGDKDNFDSIILCTGYKIDLNYLDPKLKKIVFNDDEETILDLYKQVFHPKVGQSLGFIGFLQPSSGGLLTSSEIQARWFVHLLKKDVKLPSESEMNESIVKDQERCLKRFHSSKRHTIQQDPIVYNDEIAKLIGAKPDFLKNWFIFWRLMFSSCGPAQWRLNGPESFKDATNIVKSVPVTDMMKYFAIFYAFLAIFLVWKLLDQPLVLALIVLGYFIYKNFGKKISKKIKDVYNSHA